MASLLRARNGAGSLWIALRGLTACTATNASACKIPGVHAWLQPETKEPLGHPWTGTSLSWRHHGTLVQFPLAQTGEGISECELIQWFVKEGDTVDQFDKVCEVQSDKASIEITSRYAGVIRKTYHNVGDLVKVGAPLVDIETEEQQAEAAAAPTSAPAQVSPAAAAGPAAAAPQAPPSTSVSAAPAVRRLARELHIEISQVPGTGPNGRVLREDVERFAAQLAAPAAAPAAVAASTSAEPAAAAAAAAAAASPAMPSLAAASTATTETVRIPIRGYRRAMIRTMTEAAAVPMFYFCDEVHLDALAAARAAARADPSAAGLKLTFLPFVIKALSLALARFPILNSRLDEGAQEILQLPQHNIGVAMATPGGLVVPNVKDVAGRSVADIAAELERLRAGAAAGRLAAEDLAGGTITVSNIGTIGGTYASPLLNCPEVAIVALGKTRVVPRYDGSGALVPASLMSISWGADHRVVDGATIAAFSNCWRGFLEQPASMLLHMR